MRFRIISSSRLLAMGLLAHEPTIKTNVHLVVMPVSVTDTTRHFVYNLTSSDFKVLDNGKAVSVKVDPPDSVTAPLDLAVLIQTSDISDSALLKIRKVGTMIQDAVAGADGSAAVITFADQVNLVQDFTSNDDDLSRAFKNLKSVETREGRMLDALQEAINLLASKSGGARSVIIIIGESKDRGSETHLQDLLPKLQQSGITVYSLAYSAYLTAFTTRGTEYKPPEGGNGWIMDTIAEAVHAAKQDTCKILTASTGGTQLKFETKSKLENDLIRMGGEIHSRYILSFVPPQDAAPGFHTLSVEVTTNPLFHTQTRSGYWATSDK